MIIINAKIRVETKVYRHSAIYNECKSWKIAIIISKITFSMFHYELMFQMRFVWTKKSLYLHTIYYFEWLRDKDKMVYFSQFVYLNCINAYLMKLQFKSDKYIFIEMAHSVNGFRLSDRKYRIFHCFSTFHSSYNSLLKKIGNFFVAHRFLTQHGKYQRTQRIFNHLCVSRMQNYWLQNCSVQFIPSLPKMQRIYGHDIIPGITCHYLNSMRFSNK